MMRLSRNIKSRSIYLCANNGIRMSPNNSSEQTIPVLEWKRNFPDICSKSLKFPEFEILKYQESIKDTDWERIHLKCWRQKQKVTSTPQNVAYLFNLYNNFFLLSLLK